MSIIKCQITNNQANTKKAAHIEQFIFFKFIFQVIIFLSLSKQYYFTLSFIYPNAFTLQNGNIFIIHKKAVDIYDSLLTTKNKTIMEFKNDNNIQTKYYDIYKRTIIAKYNDGNCEYLTSIINGKIYIFNTNGEILYNSDEKLSFHDEEYYALVPMKILNKNYYYMIGYINEYKQIQLIFFKFENYTKKNTVLYNNSFSSFQEIGKFTSKLLTCQLMKSNSDNSKIICFYFINNYLEYISMDIENYSFSKNKNNKKKILSDLKVIKEIKSIINSDKSKIFICFNSDSGKGYCFTYSTNTDSFSNYTEYLSNCKKKNNVISITYIMEVNQYLYTCINENNELAISKFNSNFEFLNNSIINNYTFDNGYSIIFSNIREKYIIISDNNIEISKSFLNDNFVSFDEIRSSLKEDKLRNMQEAGIECDTSKGYYPINPKYNQNHLIECYNSNTKQPPNFYFNQNTNYYEPCYYTCATCYYGGDGNENNCTTCAVDYIFEPEKNKTTNCVAKCKNFYYYTSYGDYKCSSNKQCPEENSLLIREKNKCVESCLIDEEYKYQYSGECLKECPPDTKNDSFICKVAGQESCSQSTIHFELYDFLKGGGVENIAKTYAKEFTYTNKHISLYKNEVYSIMLYKSTSCINELQLPMPEIDFGTCYLKVKAANEIKDTLIVAIIDKMSNKNSNPITSYSFYHPVTGKKLDSESACKEEVIVVKENIKSLLNDSVQDMDSILFLTEQNIDVFNKSSGFYTDICYHYESPCNKDVALRDRLLIYYPNITLCDSGCNNAGVNLTAMTAICECKFKEMSDDEENDDNSNIYQSAVNEVFNILNQINLAIMACYKDIFVYEYFITCTGGLIILGLIFIQIINCCIYYFISFFSIQKYMYNITENYILYLNKSPFYKPYINKLNEEEKDKKDKRSNKENCPPKKESKVSEEDNINIFKIHNNNKENAKFKKTDKKIVKTQEGPDDKNSSNSKIAIYHNKFLKPKQRTKSNTNLNIKFEKSLLSLKSNEKSNINSLTNTSNLSKNLSFFDKYLSTQPNEMRFNDALIKDKRLFFDYFWDKLKKKQVILEIFLVDDPIKPKTLKILLLILDIEVCFVMNGMFINEDYVSKLFHSDKVEYFFSFLSRSINRCIYTISVSLFLSYIVGCFFIEEKRLKSIFKYEKNCINTIKYEVSLVMREMKWRYNIFIVFTAIASIFSWYYISCFNNIYPHMKSEWIKSSIFIILLIHLISIFDTTVETLLRFISFEIKSEKMYKASLWLA